ncbi:MAG: hypothetical protein KGH66_01510 [Candidatus Micrarchaeota archaeon]|nr:hypothetical protein [Candidatus Micrarchaeota archaeon]
MPSIAVLAIAAALAVGIMLPDLAFAFNNPSFNTVTATLTIPSVCTVTVSNTAINFGSVSPTSNAPTANAVTDTNAGGVPANILLDGTNWVYLSNSFFVSNTEWDFSSNPGLSGNTLGIAPGNLVDTYNVIGSTQKVTLFFGIFVPPQQAVGTYTQTVTVENKC